MQKYTVSFRIYGKALKVNVMAISSADAKHRVVDAIQFDKVEKESQASAMPNGDVMLDHLKNSFGMK